MHAASWPQILMPWGRMKRVAAVTIRGLSHFTPELLGRFCMLLLHRPWHRQKSGTCLTNRSAAAMAAVMLDRFLTTLPEHLNLAMKPWVSVPWICVDSCGFRSVLFCGFSCFLGLLVDMLLACFCDLAHRVAKLISWAAHSTLPNRKTSDCHVALNSTLTLQAPHVKDMSSFLMNCRYHS